LALNINHSLTPIFSITYKPKTIFNGKGVRIVDVNGNGLVDYLQCDTAGA
jgi:glutamate-1-semialdehyde aminotransferase